MIKKFRVKIHLEEPLNSLLDITYLVCQLAKLEKENSEENVNNKLLKVVSCYGKPINSGESWSEMLSPKYALED